MDVSCAPDWLWFPSLGTTAAKPQVERFPYYGSAIEREPGTGRGRHSGPSSGVPSGMVPFGSRSREPLEQRKRRRGS